MAADYPGGKRWAWDVSSISFGGAAQTGLMDLNVKLNEGIESFHTLSVNRGKWPSRVKHSGFRTIEVAGTMKFDNQDEYQEFLAFNERAMIANFVGPTEVASGFYETLTIKLPAMQYTDFPPAAGGPGLIEVGFTANGNYHVGSESALEIVLVNTQDAYV